MRDPHEFSPQAAGIWQALSAGVVAVPGLLLRHYKSLHLTEFDVMVYLQLLQFQENEGKTLPTWDELAERMTGRPETIAASLKRLLEAGVLRIVSEVDKATGVMNEYYDLTPMRKKLAEVSGSGEEADPAPGPQPAVTAGKGTKTDIYQAFEQEFARPLSPMEYETITEWIETDQYDEELILLALKEAVFAGKVHFRYIDRILLDWKRNRIRTVQQAKEHAGQFRGAR